jgi:hypothetical protein
MARSTPIDPAVAAAMRPFPEGHCGNPSNGHPECGIDAVADRLASILAPAV